MVLRRFWPDARPFRRWIPVLLALIAVAAALETAEIWMFKLFVDQVLVPGDLAPLAWIAIAYVTISLLGALTAFGDDYLATSLAERFLLAMRMRIFGHMQHLSLDVFDRHRLGDLISRITSDVQQIEGLLLSGFSDGLAAVLRIAFFTGALFILDWQLALVAVVVAPLFWVVGKRFSTLIKRVSREKRRRSGSLSTLAEESFSNAALVQASNGQQAALDRFERQNRSLIEAELASTRIRGLFSPLVQLIELAAVLLVFYFGTRAVADGSLTIGGMLVFVAYLSQLYAPIQELSSLANYYFRALAGAERVLELLDEKPRVADAPHARPLRRVAGAIEFEHVDFRYPDAHRGAIRDLDLRIEPGETVALVGASGAGKTTVARLLLRFYDPTAGSIAVDHHDLRDVTLDSLRSSISVLLQEGIVLHGSVRENIALSRPGAGDAEIAAAAEAAGAAGFIAELEHGYETDLGERGGRLSGGQRQRIAIARALLDDAPILILDEPATGLDAEAKAQLAEPLRRLTRERTSLVISHDLITTRDADRIVVLEHGTVAESGDHAELLAADGIYAKLWALGDGGRSALEVAA
jgi:ABC-type multidrug transport system fused ATPase/permease subunit